MRPSMLVIENLDMFARAGAKASFLAHFLRELEGHIGLNFLAIILTTEEELPRQLSKVFSYRCEVPLPSAFDRYEYLLAHRATRLMVAPALLQITKEEGKEEGETQETSLSIWNRRYLTGFTFSDLSDLVDRLVDHFDHLETIDARLDLPALSQSVAEIVPRLGLHLEVGSSHGIEKEVKWEDFVGYEEIKVH